MSVKQTQAPPSLLLVDNIKMHGIPSKDKWKMQTLFALHFKFWKYFLWKFVRYIHQIFYFLLFYISFYILRYHQISFCTKFLTLIQYFLKKDFRHKFFFFNGFTNPPITDPLNPLINSQNPLNMTKVFCRCFLTL